MSALNLVSRKGQQVVTSVGSYEEEVMGLKNAQLNVRLDKSNIAALLMKLEQMNDTSNLWARRVDRGEFLDALYKAAAANDMNKLFVAGARGRLAPKASWANWTQIRFRALSAEFNEVKVEFYRGRGIYAAFVKLPRFGTLYASYIVDRDDAMAFAVGQKLLAKPPAPIVISY